MSESEEKEQRDGLTTAAPEDQVASEGNASSEGCSVAMYYGDRCGRPIHPAPAHDSTPVCLMHSSDPEKSDAEFQQEVDAILEVAREGVADFTGFVFPSAYYRGSYFKVACAFYRATFTRDADFRQVTFAKDADFRQARFNEALFALTTFTKDANFRQARFNKAHFGDATFTQKADFGEATFTKMADFYQATFAGRADFVDASFTEDPQFPQPRFNEAYLSEAAFTEDPQFPHPCFIDAYFALTTFSKDADFRRAMFSEADFRGATFRRDADFRSATFTRNAKFYKTTFAELAIFALARFLGPAEFRETHFRQDNEPFPGPIFSLAEFSQPEAVIFYKTYLGQALFHNCDASKVNFSSVEWRKRSGSGKRMVFEEDVHVGAAPDLKPAKDSPDELNYGLIAELYQQLKKNYDERKDYWTAGDFHYGEMEMKRLATPRAEQLARLFGWLRAKVRHVTWIDQTEKLVHRNRRGWHRRMSLVKWYKRASQYGESYVRPALWFGATLLFFALLYPLVGLHDSAKETAGITASPGPVVVMAYSNPLVPGQPAADRHKAQWRLFGKSLLTTLEIAAFQKEPIYKPVGARGRVLTLFEMLLTSTLAALFFLAVRRQFRR